MRALGVALALEERAQAAVRKTVRDEVEVVEDDQRAELERRVDRSARGAPDDGGGAELVQRPDVRAVVDGVREAHVPRAVSREVEDLDIRVGPPRDPGLTPRGLHASSLAALEAWQCVGARARDDPHRHLRRDPSARRLGRLPLFAAVQRGTRPPSAPGSVAGPRGAAIPSTRIALSPSESFSRPSVDWTSSPVSSLTRSNR